MEISLQRDDVVEHEQHGRCVIKSFSRKIEGLHHDPMKYEAVPFSRYYVDYAITKKDSPMAIKQPMEPFDEFVQGVVRKIE